MSAKLLENGPLLVQICVYCRNQCLPTFVYRREICRKFDDGTSSGYLEILGMALFYWNFRKSNAFDTPFRVVVLDAARNVT